MDGDKGEKGDIDQRVQTSSYKMLSSRDLTIVNNNVLFT